MGDLIGAGAAQEQAVVGETPNLAARIQGLAEAGHRRYRTEHEEADPHDRRVSGPGPAGTRRRQQADPGLARSPTEPYGEPFDAMHSAAHTLIGREEEVAILARCWSLARECKGQIVLLTGEPGIGKSRLVQVLLERIAAEPRISAINAHPFMFRAFHPIAAQIPKRGPIRCQDRPEQRIEAAEPDGAGGRGGS